jgi:hypothetical protein
MQQYENVYGCYAPDYQQDKYEKANAAVIKTHKPVPRFLNCELQSIVLTCRRDLRDIAASHILKHWATEQNIVSILHAAVNEHRFYEPWSVYEFDYEDLLKEPAA